MSEFGFEQGCPSKVIQVVCEGSLQALSGGRFEASRFGHGGPQSLALRGCGCFAFGRQGFEGAAPPPHTTKP